MKIKEKLAEINESIYQKFLANRRELFRLCSFFFVLYYVLVAFLGYGWLVLMEHRLKKWINLAVKLYILVIAQKMALGL
nr:hypothetical protein [uncultured Campylobacter sp.]